jgi:hypothetical protein
MFEKKDKRRLSWLIDMYLEGKITARTFCDEYYYSYDLEIDNKDLNELEQQAFSELSKISSRFSEFPEDHAALPRGFYTEEQLKKKIEETKKRLTIVDT